jgi:hypothetical protein
MIATIQENLPEKIEALLRAIDDLDFVCAGRNSQACAVPLCNIFAQWQVSVCRCVLKRYPPVLFHYLPPRIRDALHIDER